MYSVHQSYGKLPWSELLQPAISYAQNGFEVSDRFVNRLERRLEVINKNAAAREIFTKDGKAYQSGDLLIQKDKAKTLETIAKNPQSFYTGKIAQAIANDMAANGGLITLEDLKIINQFGVNLSVATFDKRKFVPCRHHHLGEFIFCKY